MGTLSNNEQTQRRNAVYLTNGTYTAEISAAGEVSTSASLSLGTDALSITGTLAIGTASPLTVGTCSVSAMPVLAVGTASPIVVTVGTASPLTVGTCSVSAVPVLNVGTCGITNVPVLNVGTCGITNVPALTVGTIGPVVTKRGGVNYTILQATGTTATQFADYILFSPSTDGKWYLTDLIISTSAANNVRLESDNGAGDAIKLRLDLAANGGCVVNFQTPLTGDENGADLIVTSGSNANLSITVTGYEA